ncbi:hypothetical protein [Phaeobacter phage MD18]|nr:hypothetical protein [Phaeobacter phage MD18]
MSYRNITVDGKDYKYVVGRTHVKVRGMEAVPKEDVGHMEDVCCECCGEPLRVLHAPITGDPNEFKQLRVSPADITAFIRRAA